MMTNSSASRLAHASNLFGRLLVVAALCVLIALPLRSPWAQGTENNTAVLIVDMQRIQREAAAAVSVRAQTATLRAELEKTIAARAKEISNEEAELAKLREGLSDSEFRARILAFEQKVFANRDFAQRESGNLQSQLAGASNRLRNRIAPILANIMRERGAQVMLDSSQVVLSADILDVTDEVIRRLNLAMPALVLEPSKAAE